MISWGIVRFPIDWEFSQEFSQSVNGGNLVSTSRGNTRSRRWEEGLLPFRASSRHRRVTNRSMPPKDVGPKISYELVVELYSTAKKKSNLTIFHAVPPKYATGRAWVNYIYYIYICYMLIYSIWLLMLDIDHGSIEPRWRRFIQRQLSTKYI